MAGRIRSIKPEILDDEKTAGLTHEAWRLFVSTWMLADDHGALRADPAWIMGQVFWATPASGGMRGVDEAIEELAAVGLVSIYEVRGQRYMQIEGWNKHQKVDHPGKPRVPRPDDEASWPVESRASNRVYFIQSETSRAIKIGVSWNPSRRLASLQAGSSERLALLGDMPGDIKTERALHRRFAASRLSGEWFSETPELLEIISGSVAIDGVVETIREPSRDKPRTLAPDLRPPTTTGTTTGTTSNEPGQPALVLIPPPPAKRDPVADVWSEQERQRSAAIPGSRPLSLTSDRRKRVQGLLDAGHTEADLLAVIGEYAREARANGGEWFNGDTNWRPDNVARTLGRIGSQPSRSGALTGMAAFHELMRERGES